MRENCPVNAEQKTAAVLSDKSNDSAHSFLSAGSLYLRFILIMKKLTITALIFLGVLVCISFTDQGLRHQYARPASEWPAPWVDEGVSWSELGALPPVPVDLNNDSVRQVVELGKTLFFDPRLSSSGKISCATCHDPALSWTDAKPRSVGHEGAIGNRNAPTVQNSWLYSKLFWDGRSRNLQDQAFAPIVSGVEMNSEMHDVVMKLRRSKTYRELFKKAFGSDFINPHVMTEAIAVFEKSIRSADSRFDRFVKGDYKALSNSELRGLHLFRTKARCINCHNSPLFSDNKFHYNGVSSTGPDNDKGYYTVTHNDNDLHKFRTPSLRDVMYTGPWMHNGKEKNLKALIELYHNDSPAPGGGRRQLGLTGKEKRDLLAFLGAISAPPLPFVKPVLPE